MENSIMETHYSPRESFLQKWNKIFVTSCVFAVVLDPLFLYVPIMKDDIKCLLFDRNLKIAALLLRSLTDLFYIFDIIIPTYTSANFLRLVDEYRVTCGLIDEDRSGRRSIIWFCMKSFVSVIAKTRLRSYILIDILAVLPLPQVAIFIFFSKLRDLRSLNTTRMVTMNLFVLLQYGPRVFRIYLSCKELKQRETGETAIWVKAILNFFIYIIASHVLGAIWYFFAIQRTVICWHDACRKENRCNTFSTFGCQDTFRNITFLNYICPISPVNTTLFNFGIYSTILQSGIPGTTNYFKKFSNCFWWGLRNLSSFGSNLEPSTDGWENLFAAFISIIGLLLFLYFIGNLQMYMQLDTARREAHRHKMKLKQKKMEVERKVKEKSDETDLWLSSNGIPKRLHNDMKLQIMDKVRPQLEENRDPDLNRIISTLPLDRQSYIKSFMPKPSLKRVPMLKNMDESVLTRICWYLKPLEFVDDVIIIEEGKPLQMMLYIVEGHVSIEKRDGSSSSSSNNLQQRGPTEVCGEELLRWPLSTSFPNVLPVATESAKAMGYVVEVLALMATDFKREFYYMQMEYFLGMTSNTRKFSEAELMNATDNYHASRIIGGDKFATFYKGQGFAVKKYTTRIRYGDVAIEAAVASQTPHINVVTFLGLCRKEDKPVLVFEYISNGTLFEHIHKLKPTALLLSLELRLKIASETAGALAYLHSFTPAPIIHQCLATKYILLDDHYTAKLSAIGQSRLFNEPYLSSDYITSISKEGYFDPHFQKDGLAEKSDVYSFGVVLAELLTSQKPVSPPGTSAMEEGHRYLASLFRTSVEEGRLGQILDAQIIVNEATSETAKKVGDLAKRCLGLQRKARPSMEQVALELEGLRKFMAEYQRGEDVEPSFA